MQTINLCDILIIGEKTRGYNTKDNRIVPVPYELNEGFYYNRNAHGDIISLLDYKGDSLNDYSYTDWGAIEETENQNFFGGQFKNLWQQETTIEYETPFTYSGEYQDLCSGLIYLRNRYYDPSIGRFISEDTQWNPNNMIYGDKEYKVGEIKIPDTNAIMQSSNLYAYCMNNPMKYIDASGDNATDILRTSWGIGGSAVALDGPFPYGDVAGTAIGAVGTIAAGSVWVYDKLSTYFSYTKEKATTNVATKTKTNNSNYTFIYRTGSGSNTNLTPRMIKDDNGLSYSSTPPIGEKYTVTTVEAVNATGALFVYQAPLKPTHYLVKATVNHSDWQQSRMNAETAPHSLTKILASISIKMPAIKGEFFHE